MPLPCLPINTLTKYLFKQERCSSYCTRTCIFVKWSWNWQEETLCMYHDHYQPLYVSMVTFQKIVITKPSFVDVIYITTWKEANLYHVFCHYEVWVAFLNKLHDLYPFHFQNTTFQNTTFNLYILDKVIFYHHLQAIRWNYTSNYNFLLPNPVHKQEMRP